MRHCFAAAMLVAGLIAFTAPARADLLIHVDKSTQQMEVSLDGAPLFVWPVSTGAPGYDTPSGNFKPFRMEAEHYSKEWDDAPMPHSIFFTMKGHAIHGSNHKSIGRPASHGCVRLEPKNAAILFDLVKQETMARTRVVLDGETPGVRAPQVARQNQQGNEYQGGTYYGNDDVVTGSIQQRRGVTRGWRESQDRPRYYYYREQRPYYPPPRRYGYDYAPPPPFPFFGR
jgi:L,D-transpeptidase catalytic domain